MDGGWRRGCGDNVSGSGAGRLFVTLGNRKARDEKGESVNEKSAESR